MLISYSHSFAFVHVPKTAGVSVHAALYPYAQHVDHYWANRWLSKVGIHVNHFAPYPLRKFRLHSTAAVLQEHLPAAVFDDLYKFAFVRNPWDMLVSYFHYVQQSPSHHRRRSVGKQADFADYVRYEIRRNKISQTRMLVDGRDRLLVDFVGRFESLVSDFNWVCTRIGIDAALPQVNRSQRGDYRDLYTDRLASLVGRHFAADIDRFGYTFENGLGAAESRPAATLRRVA